MYSYRTYKNVYLYFCIHHIDCLYKTIQIQRFYKFGMYTILKLLAQIMTVILINGVIIIISIKYLHSTCLEIFNNDRKY